MKTKTFFLTILCSYSLLAFGQSSEDTGPSEDLFLQTNAQFLEAKLAANLKKAEAKLENYRTRLNNTTDENEIKYLAKKIQSTAKKIETIKDSQTTVSLWKPKIIN